MGKQNVSWYRKYRPKTFVEYEGDFVQNAVRRFSNIALRPQIVLIHGNYGCGKTTAARLLAGFYLCDDLNEDGIPCGECGGCGQLLDLIEHGEDDAASETVIEINGSTVNRVEDIRRLMNDSMLTLPAFSKFKVFIFDECHRITPEAQNAMLKILEDVPPHLVVIFATTEPEKMLPTITSRCQLVIEVRRQSVAGMTSILEKIAQKEGLSYTVNALKIIANKRGRVPRDCINLLESVAAAYGMVVNEKNVMEYTGDVDVEIYLRFIQASHKDLAHVLRFVHEFAQSDIDYRKFVNGLSQFVMNGIYVRMGIGVKDHDKNFADALDELFVLYKPREYNVLLELIDDALKRSNVDTGSMELALTTLGQRIGKIFISMNPEKVAADSKAETEAGVAEYVKKEAAHEKKVAQQKMNANADAGTDLNALLAKIGVGSEVS
jgi:DNA polymerase-3 subunit gamma/tau